MTEKNESATGKDAGRKENPARALPEAERTAEADVTVGLKPREKAAAGVALTDAEQAQVVDFKAASEQAEEDFLAQANASARTAVSNRMPVPEPGLGEADMTKNDAGQLIEPEVLAIQKRQEQELADRKAAADEARAAQDQGPRTEANHPGKFSK